MQGKGERRASTEGYGEPRGRRQEGDKVKQGHALSLWVKKSNVKDASGSSNASHVDVGEVRAERSLRSFRSEWWFI